MNTSRHLKDTFTKLLLQRTWAVLLTLGLVAVLTPATAQAQGGVPGPGPHSLEGKWQATSFANTTKIDWTITVAGNAIILTMSPDQGKPITVRGSYALENDQLTIMYLLAKDKAQAPELSKMSFGQLTWLNNNCFTLKKGKSLLTFQRAGVDALGGLNENSPDKKGGSSQGQPGQYSLQGKWQATSFANKMKIDWTWTVTGNQIKIVVTNSQGKTITINGTYELDGNQLILVAFGKSNNFGRLTWLNKDSFTIDDGKLQLTYSRVDAGVQDGLKKDVGGGVGEGSK